MLKLIVCFTFLTVTIVAANYVFHDPDFNLTMEIEDKPLRFRRATDDDVVDDDDDDVKKPIKQEKDFHCCSGKKGDPQVLKVTSEINKQCSARIRRERGSDHDFFERMQSFREKRFCRAECIAKKLNLLDASGEFKRDSLLNHTRKYIGESRWNVGKLKKYIDGCLDSLKTRKDDEKKSEKPLCNPLPSEYRKCIWKKLVKGCPAESQIDSRTCQRIRELVKISDTYHANKRKNSSFFNI